MNQILVFKTPEGLAGYAADLLVADIKGHRGGQKYRVALSGGSTPRLLYQALRERDAVGELLRDRVEFYFSDERAVGPECEQSNYRLANLELFVPLGISAESVFRMQGEAGDLEGEAARYEQVIRTRVGQGEDAAPQFDLIFLGMGPDGHTASLFPDFDFDGAEKQLIAAPYVSSQKGRRLTFTVELINRARKVVFLVTGVNKGEALTKVLSSSIKGSNLPAGRIRATDTIWLLDRAAAEALAGQEINGTMREC
ncbi:MAG: 6-phosphogluconolactonase [Candidatus Zixiibacteriota bacterium]